MLFNSIDFAVFLPIVFTIYWLLSKYKYQYQNVLILVASYVFYGWWDWRFLFLVFFSSFLDFIVGQKMAQSSSQKQRKRLLVLSLCVNLGSLGFFKYYNFFVDSFIESFSLLGMAFNAPSLNVILPVGISFYTFQTLSYSIDVYRKKLEPTRDFIGFAAFVSFFPQLVAGPIERATNLLPQFSRKRVFEYARAVDGLRQVLWGLFKKVVIADNCAEFANQIFNNSAEQSGSTLLIGAFFFAFQIYGDFSGYSDMAIGMSRLFGFDLKQNFAFPYFSRDIAEFWRRWHISLSSWFRDYLYIPLGGSRGKNIKRIRNTFIIFIVSGFWHGANWTFVVWGALNAIYFLPLLLAKRNRKNIDTIAQNGQIPSFREITGMGITFFLTLIAWIFFRSESVAQGISFITEIFSTSLLTVPSFSDRQGAAIVLLLILGFLVIEWFGRKDQFAIEKLMLNWNWPFRVLAYQLTVFLIFWFGARGQEFIYFQF